MATRNYKIKLTIDNTQAQAAAEAAIKSATNMGKAYESALKKIEAAVKKADAAGGKLGQDLGQSAAAATGKVQGLTGSVAALTASARSAAAAVRAVGMGTQATSTMTNRVGSLTAALKQGETQARNTAASVTRVGSAVSAIGKPTTGFANDMGKAKAESGGLLTNLMGFSAATIGIHAVKTAIGELGNAIREAREHGEKTAQASLSGRDKARQLASLMGESGPNDRVMARISGTSLASGMTEDEARDFLQEFEGSITLGEKKGHIKKEDYGAVANAAAKSAVRLQLNPKTAGDLIGTIAGDVNLYEQRDKSGRLMTPAEAMTSQLEAAAYSLNEGKGDITTLAHGEVAAAAKAMTAGRMRQRSDVAAFVGTASQSGAKTPGSAGTFVSQMDRGLNRATGDASAFLAREGIDKFQFTEDRLRAMRGVLAREQAAAKGKGENWDPNSYLAKQGFGSEQDRAAILGFVQNFDVLEKRLAESRRMVQDPSIAASKNAAFASTRLGQNRLAEARGAAAERVTGEKGELIAIARKAAAAELEHEGVLNADDQKYAEAIRGGFGAKEWLGLPPEQQKTIDERVRRNLGVQLKNAGIDAKASGLTDTAAPPSFGSWAAGNLKFGKTTGGPLRIKESLEALEKKGLPVIGPGSGLENEMKYHDVDPMKRAQREAAKMPQGQAAGQPVATRDPQMEEQTRLLSRIADSLKSSGPLPVGILRGPANMYRA